jgi:hypothetical protein
MSKGMFWAVKRNTESGPLYRNGSRAVRKNYGKKWSVKAVTRSF